MGRIGEDLWKKMSENAKIPHFWAKTHRGYQYQLSGTGTRMQWAIGTGIGTTQTSTSTDWQWITGTGTGQSGTCTTTSNSPVFAYFASLSPVFVYQLFRDPKKRLIGVQIRIRLSEKRTVPYLAASAKRSMIICLTTKSGEFVFD